MQYWVLTNIYAVFYSAKMLSYILPHYQGKNWEINITYLHFPNEETENEEDLMCSSKVVVTHG